MEDKLKAHRLTDEKLNNLIYLVIESESPTKEYADAWYKRLMKDTKRDLK